MAEIKTEKIRLGTGDLTISPYSTLSSGTSAPNNSNGTDGDIYIRIAGANSDLYVKRSGSWLSIATLPVNAQLSNLVPPTSINASLLFDPSEVFDIGALGVNRPNNIYAKTSINSAGSLSAGTSLNVGNLTANTILQSDGSKNVVSLANGTNGQLLTMSSGVPSWQNPPASAVPTGSVITFAGSAAPTGWLICNGDTIPNGSGTVQGVTTDFSALYAVVGSNYGGAGKLPDMRRKVAMGAGGTGSSTIGNSVGDSGGEENHSLTISEIPNHNHEIGSRDSTAGFGSISNKEFVADYGYSGTGAGPSALTSYVGGSGSHNNIQPSLILNYIIKY